MAWIVTFEGCPWAFATQDVDLTSVPASSDWPSGITTGSILAGYLDETSVEAWSERINILEGDVEIGSQTFRIYDAPTSLSGSTRNPATFLLTRELTTVSSSLLATSMDSTVMAVTASVPYSSFPTGTQVIWIEEEALLCSSRSGGVFTVSQRGYYGTQARAHTIVTNDNYYPEVWAEFPWMAKRKVILWRADGVASNWFTCWFGFVNVTRLNTSNIAIGEIQCDPLWSKTKDAPFNLPPATTNLAGIQMDTVSLAADWANFAGTITQYATGSFLEDPAHNIVPVAPDLMTCLNLCKSNLFQAVQTAGGASATDFVFNLTERDTGITFESRANFLHQPSSSAGMTIGEHTWIGGGSAFASPYVISTVVGDFKPPVIHTFKTDG